MLYALRQEIGTEAFDALERAWVTKYENGVASTGDFIALASKVAGRDLGAFLHAWLYDETTPPMPGHPDWTVDPVHGAGAGAGGVGRSRRDLRSARVDAQVVAVSDGAPRAAGSGRRATAPPASTCAGAYARLACATARARARRGRARPDGGRVSCSSLR